MKKTGLIVLLLVFVCSISFSSVWAEEKKADTKKAAAIEAKEKAELSKKSELFVELVKYGEAEKDPMIMISAVKMMDTLPFKSIAKTDEKGKAAGVYERSAMLTQAKEFAAGDTELLAIIAKVQDAPEKTEVRGHHDRFGHGDRYWGGHHYYERRHHNRRYDCEWGHWGRHGWSCR